MTLKPPIRHCKICLNEIKIFDFCRLFDPNICICQSCQKELDPKFINFRVDKYSALALYEYNAFIKNQIYTYKGCFDYELKDIFLNLFLNELSYRYKGYKIIPVPSFKNDDELRGFNHVIEVFKLLGLEMLEIIEKTEHFKQAEKGAKQRRQIRKYMRIKESVDLSKTHVLIVDDIYTTGSTMKTVINLVEKLNPKSISVLVLAKTKEKGVTKI